MTLEERITEDMKTAMRAKDSAKLGAIRLLIAGVKQREVDQRIVLDDAALLVVVEKLIKQRRDSITQYDAAGRADLADAERFELDILSAYKPAGMPEAEVDAAIAAAMQSTGAAGPADMGKLMAVLKPLLAGRADMAQVSVKVKAASAAKS